MLAYVILLPTQPSLYELAHFMPTQNLD